MGKRFIPMEFSIFVMISVAVFLAHGDSPKDDKRYNPNPDRITSGSLEHVNEKIAHSRSKTGDESTFDEGIERGELEENESEKEKRRNDKKRYNRKYKYDPALAFMGLGKRISQYDPALNYMGLGKRRTQFDPALRYLGLGKRTKGYDPGLRYMGLGKRSASYDPGLKFMGSGKGEYKLDLHDNLPFEANLSDGSSAFNGPQILSFDEYSRYNEVNKKGGKFDPALMFMGLGKRKFTYDPAMKYMGLGKRKFSYDPAMKYMGLGKRKFAYDPAIKYMGLGKRQSIYDPALKYMGLGKRPFTYDPAMQYMGLGKRQFTYDPAMRYMGLGKRINEDDSTELQKSSFSPIIDDETPDESLQMSEYAESHDLKLNKRSSKFGSTLRNSNNNKKYFNDRFENMPGLGKRPYKLDPALRFMGLGKRAEIDNNLPEHDKLDPALKYMGLGKRLHPYFEKNILLDIFGDNGSAYYKNNNSNNHIKEKESFNDNTRKETKNKERHEEIFKNMNDNNLHSNTIEQDYEKGRNYGLGNEESFQSPTKLTFDPRDTFVEISKRGGMYDPALLYMGLGKRFELSHSPKLYYGFGNEEKGEHKTAKEIEVDISELRKHSNDTKGCGDMCLRRKKRSILSRIVLDAGDFKEGKIKKSEITGNEIKQMDVVTEMKKRERDNRPRYNPGWIFIGLGKRNAVNENILPLKRMENRFKRQTSYGILFNGYYGLLDQINNKIQDIGFSEMDEKGKLLKSLKHMNQEEYPSDYLKNDRNDDYDEYLWSMPITPKVVITDRISPDTWLDAMPSIAKIGN